MNQSEARNACWTVALSGGLGNQLFQYAAARSASLRTRSELVLDTTFYWRQRQRRRDLEIVQFPIAGRVDRVPTTLPQLQLAWKSLQTCFGTGRSFRETNYPFDSAFERIDTPCRLEGYFQSERYFESHADQIRDELRIPVPSHHAVQELGKEIADSGAISLHVRRGDYVSDPKASSIYSQCSPEYYGQAIEYIGGDLPVYVFSDDLRWAMENIPKSKRIFFPDIDTPNRPMADLWMMSKARHHIIANSTFSWWGAWLGEPDTGITVAPLRWFRDPSQNDVDLIPSRWIRL